MGSTGRALNAEEKIAFVLIIKMGAERGSVITVVMVTGLILLNDFLILILFPLRLEWLNVYRLPRR